jgi:positive regulator of sigma E activity
LELETCPPRDCGGCKVCRPGADKLVIKTRRKYARGRIVQVELNAVYFWRALGLLIILPLLTLIAGLSVLLRAGAPEILAAAGALAVCLLEYAGIYFYDRTIQTADLYRIVR